MKIICIGRNYLEHAKELGNEQAEEPVFFLKPDTALLRANEDFYLPEFSNDIQYEVEVVLKICKNGKSISPQFAKNYYQEIGLGIDFTARDLQNELKNKGLPWEKAKSFDHSAVISTQFIPCNSFPNSNAIPFELKLNNTTVQIGNTKDMAFSFEEIITYVSKFITLKTGDLIFTGTPKGVGKVSVGDCLIGNLAATELFNFKVK